MLISERKRNWNQSAREQLDGTKKLFRDWFRDRHQQEMALGALMNRLLFDLRAIERLTERPGTIALTCENLVPGPYESQQLNEFFEQTIALRGFKAPTDYRECFEDADVFRETIISFLRSVLQYDSFIPQAVRTLMAAS